MSTLSFLRPFKQRGFLLLEYLIALALFALALIYGDAIFALHARVKQKIESQNSTITQLRQIQLHLQPMIAQAGYLGCQNIKNVKQIIVHDGLESRLSQGHALYVQQNNQQQVLLLEQVGEWSVSLQQAMQDVDDALILTRLPAENYQWFVIDDCETVEVFAADVTQYANATKIQSKHNLSKAYQEHAIISPWVVQSFYITQDDVLQSKLLVPEQAALSLHNNIQAWQLQLWPNVLQMDVVIKQEYSLWFAH